MSIVKKIKPLTVNVAFTLPFDLLAVVLFIVPLFMGMPEWYLTMETIMGMIVVFFMAIVTSSLIFLHWFNSRPNPEAKFFTKKQILSWFIVSIILTSMFIQEMDTLFSLCLLLFAAINVMKYMWMKNPA